MSFEILKQLKYSSFCDYGDNLNSAPSRIIPPSIIDEKYDKDVEIIYYIPVRLGKEYIVCDNTKKLPEPSAYFRAPNTFLKSLLYMSNLSFYENVSTSLKADGILNLYMRDVFEKLNNLTFNEVENLQPYRKLIQIILNNTGGTFDTDPDKNPFFSKFINIILKKEKCNIIVVRSDCDGNYYDTVPSKIPNLNIQPTGKINYILLLNSNGLYSPYGKAYSDN